MQAIENGLAWLQDAEADAEATAGGGSASADDAAAAGSAEARQQGGASTSAPSGAGKGKRKAMTAEDVMAKHAEKGRKAREAEKQATWFDLKVNTSVYVTGLPDDVMETEVAEVRLASLACDLWHVVPYLHVGCALMHSNYLHQCMVDVM